LHHGLLRGIKWVLLAIWLGAFVSCLLIPILLSRDIPDLWIELLDQVIDTFAPSLTVMIAFLYRGVGTRTTESTPALGAVAVALCLVYCGLFTGIMFAFALDGLKAYEVTQLFKYVRPKTAFLVTGVITYYFGSLGTGGRNYRALVAAPTAGPDVVK
jgi:hypothetical protein